MKNKFKILMSAILCVLLYTSGYAQDKIVKGKITDPTGFPLPGANVNIKGTKKATITDIDGKYAISASSGEVLVITYTGSKKQEITIGSSAVYDVILKDETSTLEEVVVVGYGTKKKKDLTGSIVSVGAEQIASRPVQDAVQAMQGKAAGVDIGSNERPGQVGSITIRGVRSISASNSPLYVVDGIPLTSGGIDFINPTDIESIDVLKDASATAIYGSRGANGVVIVSTKKGKNGKLTLSYSTSLTTETLHNFAPMMNAAEAIDFRRWAKYYEKPTIAKGNAPSYENDKTIFLSIADPSAWANIENGWKNANGVVPTNDNERVWDGSKVQTTDWTEFVTRTGITQQHTLSASGGTDKLKGYGSFGYINNTGSLIGQAYKRLNGVANVDITPTSWLSLGSNINISYSVNEYGASGVGRSATTSTSGIYPSARNLPSYAVPYDSNGNRVLVPGGESAARTVVDEDKLSQDQRTTIRVFGSFYSQFDFGAFSNKLKGLKYRINFGPDLSLYRNGVFLDGLSSVRGGTAAANQNSTASFASLNNEQTLSYTLDNLLFYNKTLGKHDFGLTLLESRTFYNKNESFISATGIKNLDSKWNAINATNATTLTNYTTGITESAIHSYMGRINYGFDDKYLFTASGRYDGASQLSPGNKWSFFPSASLAWSLNKEKFMQNINWINQLKLRAGYGVTGNAAVDPYTTKPILNDILYGALVGVNNNTSLENPSLTWEQTSQYNYGLDFSVFKSRISGSLEYYTSTTNELLFKAAGVSVNGYLDGYKNIGITKGNGVELTLNTTNVTTKNFEWTSNFSGSWQRSEIVELQNGKNDDTNNNLFIGYPVNVYYGFKADGVWKAEDAAEMAKYVTEDGKPIFTVGNTKPVDVDKNGVIDTRDRVVIGSRNPEFITGLTNTFKFKQFEFSIFLYGKMNYLVSTAETLDARVGQRKIDYYTDVNTNAEYQKPIYSASVIDTYFGALGYKDGSFLKIRNISLGYNLTDDLAKKIGISKMRLYIQATNPFMVFSNVKHMDLDTNTFASNRGFTFGLNMTF